MLTLVTRPRGRLLEIGAGDGFQAALLKRHFAAVDAVDVSRSTPVDELMFPVQPYDGHRLPFADRTFDVVFSSNVLEHLAHVEVFQREICRVLRPGGRAVHILPSSTWRAWTILTHYFDVGIRAARRMDFTNKAGPPGVSRPNAAPSWRARIAYALMERRHGERGTTVGELYLFSRVAWRRLFVRCGFDIEAIAPLGIFYTGYSLMGGRIGIAGRQRMARILGSASSAYVLRVRD